MSFFVQKIKFQIQVLLVLLTAFWGMASAQLVDDMTDARVNFSPPKQTLMEDGKRILVEVTTSLVPIEFNGVIVQGWSSDKQMEAYINFQEGVGQGIWKMHPMHSGTDMAFLAGFVFRNVFHQKNSKFNLRFILNKENISDFGIVGIGVFDSRDGPY